MEASWHLLAQEVAEQFAPVIYQDVADGPLNDPGMRRRDLLTTVDFDGTLDPTDSEDNVDDYAMPGGVYYDAVETETHWYLLYSFYHALDWNEFGFTDHENDMEHAWLVVEKELDDSLVVIALHTQAHGETFAWTTLSGNFPVEAEPIALDGDHPMLFIESHGHGPAMCSFGGGLPYTQEIDCTPASEEDMVIYRVRPGAGIADMVEPGVENDVPVEAEYALVRAYDSLWPVRTEIEDEAGDPPMWDEPFEYAPGRNGDYSAANDIPVQGGTWGADFAGDEGGGGGVPPWGYLVSDDYISGKAYGGRGDWLLDPAALFATMYRDYSCSDRESFYNYLGNPYLSETADAPNWTGIDQQRRCDGTLWPEDTGSTSPADTADVGDADPGNDTTTANASSDSASEEPPPTGTARECGCSAGASPTVASASLFALFAARRRKDW